MLSRLVLPERNLVLAGRLRTAGSAPGRMRGLLGRDPLGHGEGLLLSPCKQVHTFGMRYPIDVVFCDAQWRVTRVVRDMRPWRVSRIEWQARTAIELPPGAASGVAVGDRLLVEPAEL